jgi:hypothetical protein
LRKLHGVHALLAGLEREGPEEAHHRREARFAFVGLGGVGGVAAAERQQSIELAAVGAGDFIEQIQVGAPRACRTRCAGLAS